MKSTLNTTILISGLLLVFSSSSFSQAGTLDSSFGVNGTVTNTFGYDYLYPSAVAIQSDGKILVAGILDWNVDSLILARYNVNGNLDSSFGSNGKASISLRWNDEIIFYRAVDMLIQNDGKIVVGGCTTRAWGNWYLIDRFLPNGNLDSSFGVNGKVSTLIHNWREVSLSALALQNDGKILAGGSVDGFCLIRYLSNGIIDSSFGVNGRIQNEGDFRIIYDVAVLNNDKIIVGVTNSSSDTATGQYIQHFEIDRLLQKGTFDSTFGNNGMVITEFSGDDWLSSIAISNNNQIVASGTSYPDGNTSLAKYKANGTPDSSFGVNGKLHSTFAAGYSKVVIQKEGKLIIAGSLLARLNSNGSTDSSYGLNGTAEYFGGASDAAMQSDEKVVTVNSPYFTLQRFKGDPTTVSILRNISAFEGNSSTTPVTFKIVLNTPSTQTIKVHYATQDGKAKASTDYIATSGTLTFRPGQVSKTVVVNVIGDNVVETNERFYLQLSNPQNAILGNLSSATCIIKNDDAGFAGATSEEDNSSINKNSISLYPNPVKDVLELEGLNANNKTTISIIDVQGKVIIKTTSSNSSTSLNVKQLQAGTYLVKIETGVSTTSIKFVKE